MKISKKSKGILKRKVEEFNSQHLVKVTEDRMLEYMIEEFNLSTPEEKLNLYRRKSNAHLEFIQTLPNILPSSPDDILKLLAKAWNDGWKVGWYQFQDRKKSCHILKREE
jgi:hypothetical protein